MDHNSASASELLAGALQDTKAATIVGAIDGAGIEPDIEIKSDRLLPRAFAFDADVNDDAQLAKGVEILSGQINNNQ